MRVKGIAIIDLVKAIRSAKDRDWSRFLNASDLAIAKGIVLPVSYYPGDTFRRMMWAVMQELGRGSAETALQYGRNSATSYLGVYQRLVVAGDAARTLENFIGLWENFYDCEGARHEKMTLDTRPGQIRIVAHDYPDMNVPEVRSLYFYGLAGYFQEIAERASGKRVRTAVNDQGTSFELTYTWL